MFGRGKGGKAKAKDKNRSSRAISFQGEEFTRFLRKGHYADYIGSRAQVYFYIIFGLLIRMSIS